MYLMDLTCTLVSIIGRHRAMASHDDGLIVMNIF